MFKFAKKDGPDIGANLEKLYPGLDYEDPYLEWVGPIEALSFWSSLFTVCNNGFYTLIQTLYPSTGLHENPTFNQESDCTQKAPKKKSHLDDSHQAE